LRLLGIPVEPPQAVVNRVISDVAAVARLARSAPAQLDRLLAIGEEIAQTGRAVREIAERLDERADAILSLGQRLDARASEMLDLGQRVDARGAEIVEAANRVAETGSELITVLPALERAIEMATPLEGAIDRFGRLVDMLPGGAARRRAEEAADAADAARSEAAAAREQGGDTERSPNSEAD
jgi:hypothetical protein